MEGLRGSKGPDIMGFDLMQCEGLLVRELITKITVCLIHEEMVAGEMSLSKPFLKETKTNSFFCLRSEVLSK